MALKNTIDPAHAQGALTGWLAAKLPDGTDHRISDVRIPVESGISAETVMFRARWTDEAGEHDQGMVARVQPLTGGVFRSCDLTPEFRLMQALGKHTDVPVPEVLWLEPDDTVLGAPFLVMEHVDGDVPRDDPPFTATGWVVELTEADQATLHDNGLRALAAIHAVDVATVELGFLGETEMGFATVACAVETWRSFFDFAAEGEHNPTLEAAFDWLTDNRPPEPERVVVSWGDARLGNVIFAADLSVAAVLDWEFAALGAPEIDLAWWLFILRHHTEGIGVSMPPGFPSRAETIARYESLTGHTTEHLEYYEVFAAARLATAMVRAAHMMIAAGLLPPDATMAHTNPAARLLAGMLGLDAPTGETQTFIGNRR